MTTATTAGGRIPMTIVTHLLDRSGSMEAIRDDTIGGFNAYVDGLKDVPNLIFTALQFDTSSLDKICVKKPIAEVPRLTRETFVPRAGTPLIDAAVKAIHATADVVRDLGDVLDLKVVVAIQTDGAENSSREFRLPYLQDLVKEKTQAGWEFIFMGAGFDAYGTADSLGISRKNTMSYGRNNSAEAFASFASNTRAYAGGAVGGMSFTASQKLDAGDVYDPSLKPGLKPSAIVPRMRDAEASFASAGAGGVVSASTTIVDQIDLRD